MPDLSGHQLPPGKHRWRWITAALAVLATVIVLMSEVEDTADVERDEGPVALPLVTALEAEAGTITARVNAFAELRPRWDAEIRAAVAGRIVEVHSAALAGERVEAGAQLFSIEKTPYETAMAAAELGLEEARLALWRAENDVTLARGEFERSGATPPNALALRLPQLEIAKRNVTLAEAQLAAARRQLADTQVSAPFSGFVTRRMASLGQTVSAGEALIHLSDDRQFEITAELSRADWALLEHPIAGTVAELFHSNGAPLGSARVRRGGGFLDQQTRQPRLFLEVIDPGEQLLAGEFVRISLSGRSLTNTLRLPESALTQEGYIWLVDEDDLLERLPANILYRSNGQLVIRAPEGSGPWRIAATPLASFLPGQRVAPQNAGS